MNAKNSAEWFEDTCVRISKIVRVGGPRKTHATRTAWQIKAQYLICEADTRKEARELAAIYVAMMRLGGKDV